MLSSDLRNFNLENQNIFKFFFLASDYKFLAFLLFCVAVFADTLYGMCRTELYKLHNHISVELSQCR